MTHGRLTHAIEAAEERKQAALGLPVNEGVSINFTSEDQTRRTISGFDIDYDELRTIAQRAGELYASMAMHLSLAHTHEAAWTEGLLVGLFAGLPPATSEVGGTDATGSEDGPPISSDDT